MTRARLIPLLASALIAGSAWAGVLSPRGLCLAEAPSRSAADSLVQVYITVDPAEFSTCVLEELGATVDLDLGDILTARMPVGALRAAADAKGVVYVETATPAAAMLDIAAVETGARQVNAGTQELGPCTGSGVIVGVVDAGFDYGHAAFRDADGRCRISRVWEQGSYPTGLQHSPERFGYGIEFDSVDDLMEAAGDIPNNSHGTHVTSIAAGRDGHYDGKLNGMAPDAEIVLVSMVEAGTSNVNISNGLAYIFDYAESRGLPCVINLSLGAHSGPHDGTSTFDKVLDRLVGPGRLVVGASGNHRAEKIHLRREFKAGDPKLSTILEYRNTPSEGVGEIEIWSESTDVEVALVAYKLSTGEAVERAVVSDATAEAQSLTLGRNISGEFSAVAEISPLNGKKHIYLGSNVRSIRNDYAIVLEIAPKSAGVVDAWTDSFITFSDHGIEGFATTIDEPTLCEIGGTAGRILTVGAYATRSEYTLKGSTTPDKLNETDGDLCSFSSCGPTADGRIKPQVTAPGCFINGAVSNYDTSGTLFPSMSFADGGRDMTYGYMQGTSMASPAVAGIVATWLQANPQLDPEQLADIVAKTSRTDDFTGALTRPNSQWGYGKVDALAGLRAAADLASVRPTTAPVTSVTASKDFITVTFGADMQRTTVSLYGADGSLIAEKRLGRVNLGDKTTLPRHGFCIVKVESEGGVYVRKAL